MAKAVAKSKKIRSEIKAICAGPQGRAAGRGPQGAEEEPGQAGAKAAAKAASQGCGQDGRARPP